MYSEDGTSIELGNYFVRLVCINGQTRKTKHRDSVVYNFLNTDSGKLLRLTTDKHAMQVAFMEFKQKLELASCSTVSLRELGYMYNQMHCFSSLIPKDAVEALLPFTEIQKHYEQKGLDIKRMGHLAKSNLTWWELYNRLTEFATHNTFMAADDLKRTRIANIAMRGLMYEYDIKNHIDSIETVHIINFFVHLL